VIKRTYYYLGSGLDPFANLALEEYFLDTADPESCLLYLWQNENTVVIGRNQNAWKECKVELLEIGGGRLARRPSGGGAVFHDLGNLNFTFLMHQKNYDLQRQLAVILEAVQSLGIRAEQTGRNDLTADGRKFSGNAFYHKGENAYHHGTLLMDVDMGSLTQYLQVDPSKLQSKGVESVRSRVMNLREQCPDLTLPMMQQALLEAFGSVYGAEPRPLPPDKIHWDQVARLQEKYASWEWRLGRQIQFKYNQNQRFAWGNADIHLEVDRGCVTGAAVFSDAMEAQLIAGLGPRLQGCRFEGAALAAALEGMKLSAATENDGIILRDVQAMLGRLLEEAAGTGKESNHAEPI